MEPRELLGGLLLASLATMSRKCPIPPTRLEVAMTWRVFVLLMVAGVGITVVLVTIASIFDLGDEQRHWLEAVIICVIFLGFFAWQRWRGD